MQVPRYNALVVEVAARVLVWMVFIYMELCTPFVRVVQPEELWLYKYPRAKQAYVSAYGLWMISITLPLAIVTIDYVRTRNRLDYKNCMLGLSLLLGLNGFITVFMKLTVGRLRPDFYERCFPDGIGNDELDCTGDDRTVMEGRKSFPSGHASFSFSSMVFISLYLSERMQIFGRNRGCAWRLITCLMPLLLATAVAISRTCDYHHHWQDVVGGAILGSLLAYVCYHQYLPSTLSTNQSPHTTGSTE